MKENVVISAETLLVSSPPPPPPWTVPPSTGGLRWTQPLPILRLGREEKRREGGRASIVLSLNLIRVFLLIVSLFT
jgi:hypothetical protein